MLVNQTTQTKRMPKPMILLIGVLFISVGIFCGYKFIHNGKVMTAEAQARIIQIEETTEKQKKSNGSGYKTVKYYQPILSYTINGKAYEGPSDQLSRNADEYSIGDTMTIRYNPDNPAEFEIAGESAKGNLIAAAASILAGLLCFVLFFKP